MINKLLTRLYPVRYNLTNTDTESIKRAGLVSHSAHENGKLGAIKGDQKKDCVGVTSEDDLRLCVTRKLGGKY